jgi:hypothetical protein
MGFQKPLPDALRAITCGLPLQADPERTPEANQQRQSLHPVIKKFDQG